MLKINSADYDEFYEAVVRAGASICTMTGIPVVVTIDRLRGAALAALASMVSESVLIEGEIHLVPRGFVAEFMGKGTE
jgi:hypothetical protein